MHHLEQMVPFAMTAVPDMGAQQDNGILTVYDMNTKDNLKFYNEDKYWNMDLKPEFMDQTRGLWKGNFDDKRNGNIFSLTRKCTEEEAIMQQKVTRDLEAAIAKHGEAVRPSLFEDDFKQDIINRKK